MNMTIGCPIPGANKQKEPVRLIDANDVMQNVLDEIRYKESLYTLTVRRIAQRAIDAAPTIDPESLRPTAKWENGDDYYGDDIIWFCSACKNDVVLRGGTPEEYSYRYCPNCGARMVNTDEKHCT